MYYIAWMDMFMGGIKGLQYFTPDAGAGVWGQAHVLASYVILSVVRESDPTIVSFDFTTKTTDSGETKDYFFINVDRSKLRTVAFEAIKKFLSKLHIYKSMGDFDAAKKMFDGYSVVDQEMSRVRDLVIANKIPRRINLQPNVFLGQGGLPVYKGYEESFEGVVQSYVDRYPDAFLGDVYKQWAKDAAIMRRTD